MHGSTSFRTLGQWGRASYSGYYTARRGASDVGAALNFMKGMMGAAILVLPHSISFAGLYNGIIAGLVVIFFVHLSMYLLIGAKHNANAVYSLQDNKNVPSVYGPVGSYKDIAHKAFGIPGQVAVVFTLILQQTLVVSGWMIVFANTAQSVLPEGIHRHHILLAIAPIIICLSWVRYMKHLVPFSFFGVFVFLGGIIGVGFFYFSGNLSLEAFNHITHWKPVFPATPLFMSTFVYAILQIVGVLPNESSLEKPEHGQRVIGIALYLLALLDLTFASTGYIGQMYDADTVILAFPAGDFIVKIVKYCYMFVLIMTHPVGLNYACEPIEEIFFHHLLQEQPAQVEPGSINDDEDDEEISLLTGQSPSQPTKCCDPKRLWKIYVLRSCIAVVTLVVAYFVKDLTTFTSFIGSLLWPITGCILPAVLYMVVLCDRKWYKYICPVAVIAFALFIMIAGTYAAVLQVQGRLPSEVAPLE